jgi:hypothetical protein
MVRMPRGFPGMQYAGTVFTSIFFLEVCINMPIQVMSEEIEDRIELSACSMACLLCFSWF